MTEVYNKGKGAAIRWIRANADHQGEECLFWPFAQDGRGYGCLGFEGVVYKAHRMMCEVAHGPAPSPEHQAAHSCGRGHLRCVNPQHLSWKTPKENMADSVAHGTARFGRRGPNRRLTLEQVQQIIALRGEKTQQELSAMFGVSWRQIGKIQRGVSWRGGKAHKCGYPPGDPRNKRPRRKGRDGKFESAA